MPNRFVLIGVGNGFFVVCKTCQGSSRYLEFPISADWVTSYIEEHNCA